MSNFSIQEVLQEIERQASAAGMDPAVAKAIFAAENSADGNIKRTSVSGTTTSPVGARGVMQTMPRTEELLKEGGWLPTTWSFNPSDLKGQVQAGLAAIREMQSRQKDKNDPLELAAMYNGGTQAWRNYRAGLLDQLPAETRGYFEKVKTALGQSQGTQMATSQTPQQIERAASTGVPISGTPPNNGNPGGGGNTFSASRSGTSTRSTSYDAERIAAAMSSGIQLIQQGGSLDTALLDIGTAVADRKTAEQGQLLAIETIANTAAQATQAETAVAAAGATRRKQILDTANINPDVASSIANQTMSAIMSRTSRS